MEQNQPNKGSAVEQQGSDAVTPPDKNTGKTTNKIKPPKTLTLNEAIGQRAGEINACAKTHPEALPSGQMSAKMFILASGTAKSVKIEPESLNNSPLGACLRNVLMKGKYPALPADLNVTIPLTPKS